MFGAQAPTGTSSASSSERDVQSHGPPPLGTELDMTGEPALADIDDFGTFEDSVDVKADLTDEMASTIAASPPESDDVVVPAAHATDEDSEAMDSAEAIGTLVEAFDKVHAAMLEEAKETALTLGVAIAQRVIGEQVSLHADSLQSFIDEALEKVPAAAGVRLFLSPDDVERIEEIESDQWHIPGRSVSVVVDENLQIGDCRLQAPGISMDGRLSARLARLAAAARTALLLREDSP